MVDRVYKKGLPAYRRELETLSESFAGLHSQTDWRRLRVEPLLKHVTLLERASESREFSRESSRLRRCVRMFKSDLDYLRANVRLLRLVLQAEKAARGRKNKDRDR